MIIGIGVDIVDIRRIEKSYERLGKKFEQRVFTSVEIERANAKGRASKKAKASILAKRFAAKEACAKALGTGIGQGLKWTEISVVNDGKGTPTLRLTGAAKKRLDKLVPKGTKPQIYLSLTDEYPLALAFVVISAH